MTEKFKLLAAVIAAHPSRRVVGRTKLQKTIKLLQRKGFPTNYAYTNYFYGPYSDGVHAGIGMARRFQLVEEEEKTAQDGSTYYILTAAPDAELPAEIAPVLPLIEKMDAVRPVVLELAATYDAFRELGAAHSEAIEQLRAKKGAKCANGNEEAALDLLRELGLPTN